MPIRYDVHEDAHLIHVVYSGNLATREVLEFLDRYEVCLRQYPNFAQLVDLSNLSRISISSSQVKCLMGLICGIYLRNLPMKGVVVVARGGIGKALAEDFVAMATSQSAVPAHYCDTMGEALGRLRVATDRHFCGHCHSSISQLRRSQNEDLLQRKKPALHPALCQCEKLH